MASQPRKPWPALAVDSPISLTRSGRWRGAIRRRSRSRLHARFLIAERGGPTPSAALDGIEVRVAGGLSSFVEQEFEGRFRDPTQQTITFRQENPIQTPLTAALLRAEIWYWFLTKRSRGRALPGISSWRQSVLQAANHWPLISSGRANEINPLRQAIRWYRAEGPLVPLREFGASIAISPWLSSTRQADLVALRELGDVLAEDSARSALARVIGNLDLLLASVPNAWLEAEVNDAVASLVALVPDAQDDVADRYRSIVENTNDPLLLQSLSRLIRNIDWTAVRPEILDWWMAYCLRHLTGATDHRFPASALLRALPRTESLQLASLSAFERHPDLLSAANALAVGPVPRSQVRHMTQLAREELRRIRTEASEGRHGFGYLVEAAHFTHLLLEYPGQAGWRDLVLFLRDPQVASSSKTGPLSELIDRRTEVPTAVHRSLAAWVRSPVVFPTLPIASLDEFKGVILRLRCIYAARSTDMLLADLLSLATGSSREGRRQAAITLAETPEAAPPETALTLSLSLSHDAASDVQGAAAQALRHGTKIAQPELRQLAWQRIVEILAEPGSVAPLSALEAVKTYDPKDLPANVQRVILDLAAAHLSYAVRRSAARVLRLPFNPATAAGDSAVAIPDADADAALVPL